MCFSEQMKLPDLFCPPLLLTPSLGIHFSKPAPKAMQFLLLFKERLSLGSHEVEEQVGFIWGGVIVEFSEEIVFCLCVCLCKHLPHVCLCVCHMCSGTCGSQRRLSGSLKLELDVVVDFLVECWNY